MSHTTDKISIVVPVYYGEKMMEQLCTRLRKCLNRLGVAYEIILVDDCGPDNSWQEILRQTQKDTHTKGVKLSRNFGQHYAITAGLESALGDWVVVMDCDLQDQPEEIEHLYKKAKEGYDVVLAQRLARQDTFLKRKSSALFYAVFGYLTETNQDASIANFGIYHRKVIQAILSLQDHIRYFPTMTQWVGFKQTKIEVTHGARDSGESSYSWSSLIRLAFNNIIAFSDKPLRMTIKLGVWVSCFSFLIGLLYLFKYFRGDIVVLGFASLMISIWFLSGIIISILGMLGLYIGKIFEQVKKRPTFIIDKKINFDDSDK